jgi:hypothetical protein
VRKKWLVLLLIVLYISQVVQIFGTVLPNTTPNYKITNPYILLLFFVSIVLIVINIVSAIRLQKHPINSKDNPLKITMAFKLGLIPFYISNFVSGLIVVILALNPLMFLLWALVALWIVYTYLTMLATSAYGISLIILLGKQNILTRRQCAKHIILQLILVADIIDSIILFKKYGKLLRPIEY